MKQGCLQTRRLLHLWHWGNAKTLLPIAEEKLEWLYIRKAIVCIPPLRGLAADCICNIRERAETETTSYTFAPLTKCLIVQTRARPIPKHVRRGGLLGADEPPFLQGVYMSMYVCSPWVLCYYIQIHTEQTPISRRPWYLNCSTYRLILLLINIYRLIP